MPVRALRRINLEDRTGTNYGLKTMNARKGIKTFSAGKTWIKSPIRPLKTMNARKGIKTFILNLLYFFI